MPHEPLPANAVVEAAISKVLAAERELHECVADCHRHAQALVEVAHQNARLISERGERRMQAIRQQHAQVLAHRLSAFQDESKLFKQAHVPTTEALARLRQAVAVVAGESTGNTP